MLIQGKREWVATSRDEEGVNAVVEFLGASSIARIFVSDRTQRQNACPNARERHLMRRTHR